jgi:hypothetical protein
MAQTPAQWRTAKLGQGLAEPSCDIRSQHLPRSAAVTGGNGSCVEQAHMVTRLAGGRTHPLATDGQVMARWPTSPLPDGKLRDDSIILDEETGRSSPGLTSISDGALARPHHIDEDRERKIMAIYRLFCLDDGHVVERADYCADDDSEALALFTLRGELTDCELWFGNRLVATIPAGQSPKLAATAPSTPVQTGLAGRSAQGAISLSGPPVENRINHPARPIPDLG